MNRLLAVASASLILSLSLAACGGGGGGSSSSGGGGSQSAGFEVPTEISAVPTNLSGSVGGVTKPGLRSKLSALKQAATDPNTDYSKAQTVKFVNEHTLEQFDIIEQVLSALAQTNYADEANVNQGPYKAMVAFQDEQNGIETKSLEPWVVDSEMIEEDGQDVNRVRLWIEETRDGFTNLIKGEFKIYQSATRREDGSYSDYGVWTLNVRFGDSASDFFAASADIDAGGRAVIKINESSPGGPGGSHQMKAVMNRSETDGFGKVMFPDFESCTQPNCTPDPVEAKYAYNTAHLAIQKGAGAVQYKDRTSITEMTHRYGMFDSVTGQDVMKSKSFGFPVEFTDAEGHRQFAYYGAWQGRHQLWAGNGAVPAGTTVKRQDRGNQDTAETYTVATQFDGTFTKRTLVPGALNDIKGIAVETWINKHFNLLHNGSTWQACDGWIDRFDPNNPFCTSGSFSTFADFDMLVVSEGDRKFVNIGRWDNVNNMPENYVYLNADPGLSGYNGVGFYKAQFPEPGTPGGMTPVSPAVKLAETDGTDLFVDIGGSIYISYTGEFGGPTTTTGWVQKELIGFDESTWTPEFGTGNVAFTPDPGREYYINSRGANFIVRRKNNSVMDANAYDVMIELQSAANPTNVASMLPSGTAYLRSPWRQDVRYTFVTSAGTNFLLLRYLSDDPNTADVDESATPTVVTNGEWGLQAYETNGTPSDFTDDRPLQADGTPVTVDQWGIPTDPNIRPVQFNWEYAQEGTGWGAQQFLLDANSNYVLLSDPIRLVPVTLTSNAGEEKSLALQYDGWMHGLPDLFHELFKNGHVMTDEISDKIINIPAGTEVTDADDATKSYLIKPLEVSQFLDVVSDPGTLDIGVADDIDLNTVPVFVEHNMGDMPETTGVKYSEGILVEE
ncbi:MAG: hypothetical protein LLH30_00870 [Candidatus Manganitrophus sp. SA1]|nr:hypothetical protein [Candidatus Manganitrophus morganii]